MTSDVASAGLQGMYRDVLRVREYFLFDPNGDYLRPSMQGRRLRGGVYRAIPQVEGRLPSLTTGLHLERDGTQLRLWNPVTRQRLLVPVQAEQRLRLQAEERADRAEMELRRLRERFGLDDEPV